MIRGGNDVTFGFQFLEIRLGNFICYTLVKKIQNRISTPSGPKIHLKPSRYGRFWPKKPKIRIRMALGRDDVTFRPNFFSRRIAPSVCFPTIYNMSRLLSQWGQQDARSGWGSKTQKISQTFGKKASAKTRIRMALGGGQKFVRLKFLFHRIALSLCFPTMYNMLGLYSGLVGYGAPRHYHAYESWPANLEKPEKSNLNWLNSNFFQISFWIASCTIPAQMTFESKISTPWRMTFSTL